MTEPKRFIKFIEWEDGSFTVQTNTKVYDLAGNVDVKESEYPLDKDCFDVAIGSMQQNLRPLLKD
jgi:hypothetical protein